MTFHIISCLLYTSQIETIVHSHEPDVEVQEETIIPVTKSYLLKGLDCPNCSAKIEKEVGELDGVQSLSLIHIWLT